MSILTSGADSEGSSPRSSELTVAKAIFRLERARNRPIEFDEIVSALAPALSAELISDSLDLLFDQGIVRADWVKLESGEVAQGLSIAGEASDYVERL